MRTLMPRLRQLLSVKHRRQRHALALIEHSELFDRDWYLEHHPDVAGSGIDPARHYLEFGWLEGRDPGPGFSTTAYLRANADVAALATNPLLHYVEYGHSEGRGAPDHAAPAPRPRPPLESFGPAAAVADFPLGADFPSRWRRSSALAPATARDLIVGGHFIGRHRDALARAEVEAALAMLARSSGQRESVAPRPVNPPPIVPMVDGWHVGGKRFRTRWRRDAASGPIVVRALQYRDGGAEVVGEALIASELDVMDARLTNPFFPLLFVFAEPEGLILGTCLLAFPSLCRGGAHYPELIVLAQPRSDATGEPIDIIAVSDQLGAQLRALEGLARPLLRAIHVDLNGGDGTHPLFQPDFKHWLARVARIAVEPLGNDRNGDPERHLATLVRVDGDDLRSNAAGTLVLASDMIPSISALAAHATEGEPKGAAIMLPFIITGEELSQPSALVTAPRTWSVAELVDFIPVYPRFEPADGSALDATLRVAAVRMPRSRALGDAELLVPVAAPRLELPPTGPASTWLIWPEGWGDETLIETLESLSLQTQAGPVTVSFVGKPSPAVEAIARGLFQRFVVAANVADALKSLATPLVGYIGQGIVLHDRRTLAVMSTALDDASVATASVVAMAVDRRGKGWAVALADAGVFGTIGDEVPAHKLASHALPLWRSAWPVHQPPRDLWMARAATVAGWMVDPVARGRHICTAVVSASYNQSRPVADAPLVPPRCEHALCVEEVVG